MQISALMRVARRLRRGAWVVPVLGWALAGFSTPAPSAPAASQPGSFSFVTAGDMRGFVGPAPAGKRYFDGACEALQTIGAGEFMLTPGDGDPPGPVRATLDRYLGTNYLWYPVIGNHETEKPATMAWLEHWGQADIPHLARRGPHGAENTTFSFDFSNSHFVILDEYFDGKMDKSKTKDLTEAIFQWLEQDLATNRQPLVWVVGHKPLESLPDMDTGRVRHGGESVSANPERFGRFLQLLQRYHVRAYICGHTHNTSVARVKGVWQADSGHARGGGDSGAPSTFLKFRVEQQRAWVDIYRADKNGEHYRLKQTVVLD